MKNRVMLKWMDRSKAAIQNEMDFEQSQLHGTASSTSVSTSTLIPKKVVQKENERVMMMENKEQGQSMERYNGNDAKEVVSTSTIAADVVVTGNITAKGDLVFDGKIDGNIDCANTLSIGGKVKGDVKASYVSINCEEVKGNIQCENRCDILGNTVVKGDINASYLTVEGKVAGNILANEKVVLHSTAVLEGNCSTPLLKVEEGAVVTGSIQMGTSKKEMHK